MADDAWRVAGAIFVEISKSEEDDDGIGRAPAWESVCATLRIAIEGLEKRRLRITNDLL